MRRVLALLLVTGSSMFGYAALERASSSVENPETRVDQNPRSCRFVLAAHDGDADIDRTIRRLQERANEVEYRVAYLERLGWAFISKARLNADPGFYVLADQTAECIEAEHPDSDEAVLLRGHVAHQQHRFGDAERYARHLVGKRDFWFDYGLLGDALMEQGKLDDAVVAYQRMMDQRPGPQAYSRAAHVRWLTGDLPGAIELMEMAARATSARDAESTAWTQVRLAHYRLQANQPDEALRHAEAALRTVPMYPAALYMRGRIQLASDDLEAAIESLGGAANAAPLPEYQWALLDAQRAAGLDREADETARGLRQRGASEDPRTYSIFLSTTGTDVDDALALAETELGQRADVHTLDAYAWALLAVGEVDRAHSYSQRALVHGTQDARLFFHAAVIAAAAGFSDQAGNWFDLAASAPQMLLPSERKLLSKATAAFLSHNPALASHGSASMGHTSF